MQIIWGLSTERPVLVQAVRWANDVVDNEALNKKKSKSARSPVIQPFAATISLLSEHRAAVAAWSNTLGSHEQSAASSTSSGPLGTGGKRTTPAMGNATTVQSLRSRATTLDAGGSGHCAWCCAFAGFPVERAASTSVQQEPAQLQSRAPVSLLTWSFVLCSVCLYFYISCVTLNTYLVKTPS